MTQSNFVLKDHANFELFSIHFRPTHLCRPCRGKIQHNPHPINVPHLTLHATQSPTVNTIKSHPSVTHSPLYKKALGSLPPLIQRLISSILIFVFPFLPLNLHNSDLVLALSPSRLSSPDLYGSEPDLHADGGFVSLFYRSDASSVRSTVQRYGGESVIR